MNEFIKYCHNIVPLTLEAIEDLESILRTAVYKKKEHIVTGDNVCNKLFFLKNGLVKYYYEADDKYIIFRFFQEGWLFTSLESFINQKPTKHQLVALEDCEVIYISYDQWSELLSKHHCLESFYNKFLSIACTKQTQRISEMMENEANIRYDNFLKEHQSIIQRISLGDLSAYLGITQVSLSRIRAKR